MKENLKKCLEIILNLYKNDNITTEELMTIINCLFDKDNEVYRYPVVIREPQKWIGEEQPITPLYQTAPDDYTKWRVTSVTM